MQKALFIKAVLIAGIFLALQVPLNMINGIVAERAARQRAVVHELAAGSYGRPVLAGPVLSVPFVEEYSETVTDRNTTKLEKRRVEGVARFFPASNAIDGHATVETKSRGLFKARVFSWRATARGEFVFDGKPEFRRARADSHIVWGKPVVSVLLDDQRGLQGTPTLDWSGQAMTFERGSTLPHVPGGLHASPPELDPAKPQRFGYTLVMGLRGTESLSIVPLAADDRIGLQSDWPHPSFGGQFLPSPSTYQRRSDGFDAQWAVTALASKAQQQLLAILEGAPECRGEGLCADHIEVRFIEPIDIYSLSDRALKYGFLFVGFTFACLVLFEILKALPIHPAQYLLVGLSLATFFLLLIGLSEHIVFWAAYLIASAACIALLTHYLSAVLQGVRGGLAFAVLLTTLYGALYGLLVSEDNALLMGSLLVFAAIAAAMMLTRNVNWYALRAPKSPSELAAPDGARPA